MYHAQSTTTLGELFGRFTHPKKADVVILPVPWQVTSVGESETALAPENILDVSWGMNTFDRLHATDKITMSMLPISQEMNALGQEHHALWNECMAAIEADALPEKKVNNEAINRIDKAFETLYTFIADKVDTYLSKNKTVGMVGGESSITLGFLHALSGYYKHFSVLHIGAQACLHDQHFGLTYAYASVMHHIYAMPSISNIVQVGLRDFCKKELDVIEGAQARRLAFFDAVYQKRMLEGDTWQKITEEVLAGLSDDVYIHIDINGLDASLCPNSNRMVPGGLRMDQVSYLVEHVVACGKKIIGFDICEVGSSPSTDWNERVGAYLLNFLALRAAKSQGK